MRILITILFFLFFWTQAKSQDFKASVAYKYLYSNQWDKAIQTYNFSRPFIVEKQPLLDHGTNFSISYIFNSSKSLKHGIDFSYSYFRSSSDNENLINVLNLHFLDIGYILHYKFNGKINSFYTDFILSATSSGMYRKINGEPFVFDETNAKALGIGGNLSVRMGYYLNLKRMCYVSPFLSLGYSPYFYSPNTEAIINQTKGLTSKNWTSILTSQIGLSFVSIPKNRTGYN